MTDRENHHTPEAVAGATEAGEASVPKLVSGLLLQDIQSLFWDPDYFLDTPNPHMGGRTPRELIGTSDERLVIDVIKGIKHGYVS